MINDSVSKSILKYLYLRIDFKTGLLASFEIESNTGYSGIFGLLMMVKQKVF